MNTKFFKIPVLLLITIAFINNGCTDKNIMTYEANFPDYLSLSEWRNTEFAISEARELKRPGKIFLLDNYLFVNEIHEGVHIFDNTNPSDPKNLGFLEVLANVDIAVKDNRMFLDSYFDLLVFDITDPANPVYLDRVEDVFEFADYGNFASYNREYPMAQLDRDAGVITGWTVKKVTEDADSYNNYFWLEGDVAFADATSGGSGSLQGSGKAGSLARFAIYEDFLYTLETRELGVFNISGTPSHLQDIRMTWNSETLFPSGDHLFVGTTLGMQVFSLSVPSNPVFLSSLEHVQSCDPVVVDGDYAYVTLSTGRTCGGTVNSLDVVNISDIASPFLESQYFLTNPRGLGTAGDLIFICDGPDGLKVYDKSDPHAIDDHQLAHFPGITANDVIPWGGVLIATSEEGIYQYDYSDPTDIRQLSLISVTQ